MGLIIYFLIAFIAFFPFYAIAKIVNVRAGVDRWGFERHEGLYGVAFICAMVWPLGIPTLILGLIFWLVKGKIDSAIVKRVKK